MPRIARVAVKDYPYHVTQRGNYRQRVFEDEEGFIKYKLSSTLGHIHYVTNPILINDSNIGIEAKDWLMFLGQDNNDEVIKEIKKHSLTGRPCGNDNFISGIEGALGREKLKAGKCGRPKKMAICP